jgi:hypothetical protein
MRPLSHYELRQLHITAAAAEAIPHQEVLRALRRHVRGDWGTINTIHRAEAEQSLRNLFPGGSQPTRPQDAGIWFGTGATFLHLQDPVRPTTLRNLMNAIHQSSLGSYLKSQAPASNRLLAAFNGEQLPRKHQSLEPPATVRHQPPPAQLAQPSQTRGHGHSH